MYCGANAHRQRTCALHAWRSPEILIRRQPPWLFEVCFLYSILCSNALNGPHRSVVLLQFQTSCAIFRHFVGWTCYGKSPSALRTFSWNRYKTDSWVCARRFSFGTVKGALSRYSVFYVDFLRSKMAARRLEAAVPANEKQAFVALFLHLFRASRSIDVGISVAGWVSYPCKVIPLSDEVGLWDLIKKVKTKRQVCPEQWWKIHGIQNRPVELHGSILNCLGPTIVQDSRPFELSGAVAYISLHSTMYTTTIDRQDTCWARFVWKDARPPLFSPQQNGAKNHWIAWQCTFKWRTQQPIK